MKTKMFTLFFALAASVGTMFAEKVQIGDLYYNLNATDQTAEVTYELGYNQNNYKGLTTANIPASVTYSGTTYSVTSIGEAAFYYCSSLTSVTIPNSVTSIGWSAFYYCRSLTSVTIPNSVTSIGDYAFENCSSLISVTIPNSVTSIGEYAFYNCSSLTSVSISSSVTDIQWYTFSGCSSLTSVVIPNSVTSIGYRAFSGCSSLTSVTIPNSVTSIGEYAFDNCSSLVSINVPCEEKERFKQLLDNDSRIKGGNSIEYAHLVNLYSNEKKGKITIFEPDDCDSLITISSTPNDGYHFVKWTDENTDNPRTFKVPQENITLGAIYNYDKTYSYLKTNQDGFGEITTDNPDVWTYSKAYGAVAKKQGDASGLLYTPEMSLLGASQVTISFQHTHKFAEDPSKELTLWVTRDYNGSWEKSQWHELPIYPYADNKTWTFVDVYITVPIKYVGEKTVFAFRYQSTNTNYATWEINDFDIQIKKGQVEIIDESDPNKGSIEISGSQELLGTAKLTACPEYGYQFTQWNDGNTDNPRYIELTQDTAFAALFEFATSGSCGKDNALTWQYNRESGTLTISGYGTLDENYTYGVEAPDNMTELIIGDGVTKIGDKAFYGFNTIRSIVIPDNVQSVGSQAFANCYYLSKVYWNVPSQADYGYVEDENRITVTLDGSNIPWEHVYLYAWDTSNNAITAAWPGNELTKDVDGNYTFTFPADYSIVNIIWNNGVEQTIDIKNVEKSTKYTLASTTGQSIVYSSMETIKMSPFCGRLRSLDGGVNYVQQIIFGDKVTRIPAHLCDRMTWLRKINFNESITEISNSAFNYCTKLQEVNLPEYVQKIGHSAFRNCTALTTLSLGTNIQTYGDYAFANNSSLASIYNYRPRPAKLGAGTFEGVDYFNCTLYVLAGSVEMYKSSGSDWKDFFFVEPIGAESVATDDVKVTPHDNTVDIVWPVVSDANTYEIEITKDGEVFCKLVFNAQGQLSSIAFAPSRANVAQQTQATGFSFTVTGLTSGTKYGYTIAASNSASQIIDTKQGSFTTTGGTTTAMDNASLDASPVKVLRNGEVLILRDGKTYTIQGQEVR